MGLMRVVKRNVFANWYLWFGVAIGVCLSFSFTDISCNAPTEDTVIEAADLTNSSRVVVKVQNVTRKPSTKKQTKLVRPRYYSTELGIREKLFVGILSSEEKINTEAIHVNRTIAHLVDKVKFFITAQQNVKNKFNLSGIVGFTDTRRVYRPFQVIKYVGDSLQDYDYYFLMHDYNYLNARRLNEIVGKISVSLNVYLGTSVKDGSYCDLDVGILLSNSVLRAMRDNLDWCVRNAVSDDDSENLGRCVHHSTRLNCQNVVQKQSVTSYKLRHFELEKYLKTLTKVESFENSVTVYPILQKSDFYLLHAYFSKQHLRNIKNEINVLSKDLEETWPPGRRVGTKPATRFDLPPKLYFNMTHMFFPDDFTNMRRHTTSDADDIQMVIDAVVAKVERKPGEFQYTRLINGYRTFQLSRGLDYQLDLEFRDLRNGKEVIKRFEICKPLSQVEFLTKPYTTENGKVTVLLPIQENETGLAMKFLDNFVDSIMERREKVLLMFVLLYQYNSTSKGPTDVYKDLKDEAIGVSNRYRSEDTKIAWVSVRLPNVEKAIRIEEYPVLNFAVVDLALRKIGLENLLLILDVHSEVTPEFLNRVKMNTVVNFQIFSAIPFRQYDPKITQIETLEIHKNTGHFDREEYKYISFYAKDYVQVRKKFRGVLPIAKSDNDIVDLLQPAYRSIGNVFKMFLEHGDEIHCFRATESALMVKYHVESDVSRSNLFLGTKAQLAKIILEYQSKAM